MADKKHNILMIWGDDIGISNLSCYSHGLKGYRTEGSAVYTIRTEHLLREQDYLSLLLSKLKIMVRRNSMWTETFSRSTESET